MLNILQINTMIIEGESCFINKTNNLLAWFTSQT